MKRFLLIILSFLIVAFGQPAFSATLGLISGFCGLALFWWACHRTFFLSFLFFFAVQLVQLSWMSSTEYVGPGLLFVWLVLSAALGLFFALFTSLIKKDMPLLTIFALSALWTLFEWLRLFFMCGFSWNPFGLSLTGFILALQFAALFGVFGFTFIAMSANLLVFTLLEKLFTAENANNVSASFAPLKVKIKLITLICLIATPFVWGAFHLKDVRPERTVNVALVQPNLPPQAVGNPSFVWERINALVKPVTKPDLVVLPEGVLPFHLNASVAGTTNRDRLQSLSETLKADVIAGVDVYETGKTYQAAVFVSDKFDFYGKRVLVPFGEEIPFSWCEPIAARFGIFSSYSRGTQAKRFEGRIKCGIGICYEETFGHIAQENSALAPELLVFISNDGWYPGNLLARQHFFHARLRAVELGLPVVRSCTTGITAALDPYGRILGELPENEPGLLEVNVPLFHVKTLYAQFANGPLIILCLLLLPWLKTFKFGKV